MIKTNGWLKVGHDCPGERGPEKDCFVDSDRLFDITCAVVIFRGQVELYHVRSVNFTRLLRVVITPSVVERRKRLEAIG